MSAREAKPLTRTGKKPRYFYGWNIVATAFMTQLSYAEHFSSNLGLFFKPLQEEFGFGRSALAAIQTIARTMEGICAPFIGPFIDRYGPRVLMPIGAIICVIGSLISSRAGAVWQLYISRGIFTALGFTLMGVLVIDVTIAKWFVRKRGRATGITRIGTYVCMFIMTPVTVYVIANKGWRTMFLVFAVFTFVTAFIPSLLFMRRRPEDMGLHPDGVEPEADKSETPSDEKRSPTRARGGLVPERTWTRGEVLKTSAFWLLAATYAIDAFAIQGINISIAPYVQDMGYGTAMVTAVLTSRGVVMAVGSVFAGFVAEHIDRPIIRAFPFMLQCASAVLFLLAKSPVFLWLAIVVYGSAGASSGVTQSVVWADYFGRPSLGTVRSMAYLFIFVLGALGPLVMNAVYDLAGSYQPAFVGLFVLFVSATFMIWVSRPPRAKGQTALQPTL